MGYLLGSRLIWAHSFLSVHLVQMPCGFGYKSMPVDEVYHFIVLMANSVYYWAVVGSTDNGAQVYSSDDWCVAFSRTKTLLIHGHQSIHSLWPWVTNFSYRYPMCFGERGQMSGKNPSGCHRFNTTWCQPHANTFRFGCPLHPNVNWRWKWLLCDCYRLTPRHSLHSISL